MAEKKPVIFKRGGFNNPNKFSLKKSEYERPEYHTWYSLPAWVEFRFKFLRKNPLCYVCNNKSVDIDHVEVHRGNKELFWKKDNVIPLCKAHHSYVTASFDKHKIQKLTQKLEWLGLMRLRNCLTRRVFVV